MLSKIFESKNKKLIKKWTKEHQEMSDLAHRVLAEYSKNNKKKAKQELKELATLTIGHLLDEDIEIYKMLKDNKKLEAKIIKMAEEFTQSFKETKIYIIEFLQK